MLKLADLRKTTRAAGTAGLRTVHPHFLRDRSLQPRIELAARYLDSMLGHARSELDQEIMVQFFGDHKLARGIAAAFADTYTFRQLAFADVLDEAACARLRERGLESASDLRLWLFHRANGAGAGFVGLAQRAGFMAAAAAELGLAADTLERLMTLDAAANAILFRAGATPRAEDIVARYNYQMASALLANSSLIRVTLRRQCAEPAAVRELCDLAGVRAELSSRELVLHGRQDVFGGWARYGARLARLVSDLLVAGLPARSLECVVEAGDRGQWLFKGDEEVLTYLGAPRTGECAAWSADVLLQTQRQLDVLFSVFAGLRRTQQHHEWRLRRAAAPAVTAGGLVPTVATAVRRQERVALVPQPTSEADTLGTLMGNHPYVALTLTSSGTIDESVDRMHEVCIALRDDIELVPDVLDLAVAASSRDASRERLRAIFDEVERTGVLTEARVAARLECSEDEVASRIGAPDAKRERDIWGIRYVEGFGLCTHRVLSRAHDAAREVAALRGAEPVGPAWTARVLGRRLREVTGASEGIECLIAYLGAA